MVTVLLAEPALAALADRFAERLPDDVSVVARFLAGEAVLDPVALPNP
jgi:hypothetical protein